MNFGINKKTFRYIKAGVLVALLATIIAAPFIARAQSAGDLGSGILTTAVQQIAQATGGGGSSCSLINPLTWPICAFEGAGTIIGGFLKVVLNIFAWLLEIVLQMNKTLVQT